MSAFGDWFSWLVSNVIVGALFPLFAMGVMHLLKSIIGGSFSINYFAPFKDGQLGFVAVGWVVSALVELLKYSVTKRDASSASILGFGLALAIFAAFSALVAAAGSVSPVLPPETHPSSKWQWIKAYPAFSTATVLCVLTLILVAIVHGVTS